MGKIGRNDPCPCGSGKKYKYCHINSQKFFMPPHYFHEMSGLTFDVGGNEMSLYKRNVALIEGIIDIFSLDKCKNKDWAEIKRTISRDHIKELYKLIAWLWPPDTDIWKLLPQPESKLRSLYLGWMRPESVLNSVVRYSLYCDEIIVMNPFMNPWFITKEYNPLVHPEDYLADTLKWMFFVIQLAPWIMKGHVVLIPDPGNFDSSLRKETWALARKRIDNLSEIDKKLMASDPQLKKYSDQDFQRMFLSTPPEAMRRKLKESDPKMSDSQVAGMLEYIEKVKDQDPYYPTNPDEKGAFGLHTSTAGGNLEMGLFLAQTTGSYLYTDFSWRWKEILSTANNSAEPRKDWSSITCAFQQLDFKFLDNVTPKFASRIKEEGRLENMRSFLRKTWKTIGSESGDSNERQTLYFKDELIEEYNKAEIEWKKIDADLTKWILSEGGIGSVITAGMDWKLPALGFAVSAVGNLLSARFERQRYKTSVPLSVFVDLNRGIRK